MSSGIKENLKVKLVGRNRLLVIKTWQPSKKPGNLLDKLKTKEVLKLEQEFNGRFRYKIKLGYSM